MHPDENSLSNVRISITSHQSWSQTFSGNTAIQATVGHLVRAFSSAECVTCLACVCVLCGWSGLSSWKLDQQNQQEAGQQQLGAAGGRHGVLTHQLAVTSRAGARCRERGGDV